MLAELGVILLLLQVGMEMDLRELAAVGRASSSVAVVGVVVPMALGYVVGLAFGYDSNTSLFLGAALVGHERRHHRARLQRSPRARVGRSAHRARARPSPTTCSVSSSSPSSCAS